MSKISILTALEIAIDMLDRVEGTSIYELQKRYYGYTDKEYDQTVKHLADMHRYLKEKRRKDNE